jgi:hypothetical protein
LSRRAATRLAWSLWALVLALDIATSVFEIMAGKANGDAVATFVLAFIVFQTLATVGAIVASEHPGNPIGWLFLAAPILMMLANASGAYVDLAVKRSLPGAVFVDLAFGPAWLVGLGLILALVVLFPDGKPPSPRWRGLGRLVAAAMVFVGVTAVFSQRKLDPPLEHTNNPVFNSGLAAVFAVVAVATGLFLVVAGLYSLTVRFRRNREQREQIKWVLLAVAFAVLVLIPSSIADSLSASFDGFPDAVWLAVIGTIPLATAIAIFRYRLYEIDRIVNRALVYGIVTALLAGAYFGIVLALQEAFSGFTRGNDLAIAGSTLAVAALFRPARRRIQAFVDRRFYRRRYDAQQTLQEFSTRLRDEIDLGTLHSELERVVRDTMQPEHVSIWLRAETAAVGSVTISGRLPGTKESR